MAPRKRQTNKHLPARVYLKHGAYFYVDFNNKWHNLGKNYANALTNYADLTTGFLLKNDRMHNVFDRYIKEAAPKKALTTYKRELYAIKFLKTAFGELKPDQITAAHVYKYMDIRAEVSPGSVNKEKAVLSCVLSYAIRWGLLKQNPCRDVRSIPTTKRKRYVTDKEYLTVLNLATPMIAIAMQLAVITGLRQGDILRLQRKNLTNAGLRVEISKTANRGRVVVYEWTPELLQVVETAKRLRPIPSLFLLCNKKGQAYSRDGFQSIWKRTIKKALKDKVIGASFSFHDLRRKAATDAEKLQGREYARQLLDHTTQQTTSQYVQGDSIVKPLSSPKILDKTKNIRQTENEEKKTG